ncbi:MAG: hypothetical protein K0S70_2950 [Microbacterium sp.]|nr:hypothetical protein [Microbacterium sp.]
MVTGSVRKSRLCRSSDSGTLLNEVTKLSSPAEKMPGRSSGSVTEKKARSGEAPRPRAASSMPGSASASDAPVTRTA